MFAVAALALFVAMVLVLIRLYLGPTLYDRVLAVNSFGTHTVLFIGVLGFFDGQTRFSGHCSFIRADQFHRYGRNPKVFSVSGYW